MWEFFSWFKFRIYIGTIYDCKPFVSKIQNYLDSNLKDNYKKYIMIRFLLGFGSGLYVGTVYECKPIIDQIKKFIEDNFPDKKD